MKKRLFIAIGASSIFKEAEVYVKKLKVNFSKKEIEIQWSPIDNWHITLVFLGSTDGEVIPGLKEGLKAACEKIASFKLKLSDFNAFPEKRDARVVWIGVQKSQNLLNLQSAVETACQKLGFTFEDREYKPHMTLGRLRNHRNVTDAMSPVERKSVGVLQVEKVILFESVGGPPFPRYSPIEVFKLQTEGPDTDSEIL